MLNVLFFEDYFSLLNFYRYRYNISKSKILTNSFQTRQVQDVIPIFPIYHNNKIFHVWLSIPLKVDENFLVFLAYNGFGKIKKWRIVVS